MFSSLFRIKNLKLTWYSQILSYVWCVWYHRRDKPLLVFVLIDWTIPNDICIGEVQHGTTEIWKKKKEESFHCKRIKKSWNDWRKAASGLQHPENGENWISRHTWSTDIGTDGMPAILVKLLTGFNDFPSKNSPFVLSVVPPRHRQLSQSCPFAPNDFPFEPTMFRFQYVSFRIWVRKSKRNKCTT